MLREQTEWNGYTWMDMTIKSIEFDFVFAICDVGNSSDFPTSSLRISNFDQSNNH